MKHLTDDSKVSFAQILISEFRSNALCPDCYMDALGVVVTEVIKQSKNPLQTIERLRIYLDYMEIESKCPTLKVSDLTTTSRADFD